MLSAVIYLFAGLLFAEVSRFADDAKGGTYPLLLIGWPIIMPIVCVRYHRGKKNGARQ